MKKKIFIMENFIEQYIEKLLDSIIEVAKGNFAVQIELAGRNDHYDALAMGINLMIDDIRMGTETLKENEKKLRSVIETANDAIITLDGKSTIIGWNNSAQKMFAYTQEEIYGRPLTVLFSQKQSTVYEKIINDFLTEKKISGDGEIVELEGLKKDGNIFPMEFSFSSWTIEKNIYFTAFVRNISDRKKLESEIRARQILENTHFELVEARRLAEESKKTKEQFLANMSHEIRTPMNAIIGMTEILEENNHDEEQKECIEAIRVSADHLLSIINDILDFSKIESGKITFEKHPFKLEKLIEGIIQTLHFTVGKKSISLNYSISKNVPPIIIGDVVRLRQILLNLCSNSIKFTESGSVKIDVQLKEQVNDDYIILFTITDTGIGISSDNLPTIFESFVQASRDTTRKYGGTGLGLTITKQLVELQGGSISVKSKQNKGSQFLFTLPLKKGEEDQVASSENEKTFVCTGLEGIKILAAEDNPMNQILIKKILNKWNLEYDIASNGKIAIEKLSQTDYDIILMDMHMPEMDGYEATEFIRKKMNTPKSLIPIIAVTANALVGEEEKCLAAGMNDYISKPLNKKKLYQKMLKLIAKNNVSKAEETIVEIKSETKSKNKKYTDLTYLKELAEGSNEFMLEMINSFITDTPQTLNNMDGAFAGKRWPELKVIAHTMKSTADFMGIHSIKETVRNIEKYAEAKTDIGSLPSLIAKTKFVCVKAMEELKIEIKNIF